jgi:hypothetical protein
MLNKYHILSPNKSNTTPVHCIFFDTETNYKVNSEGQIEHTLKLGCAIYKRFEPDLSIRSRRVCYFTTTREFYEFVMSYAKGSKKLYLFAHNVFFDLWITKFYLNAFKNGWQSLIPFYKGMTYIDRLKKKSKRIQIINVGNYFQTTVKKMGELVGLPKKEVDFKNVSNLQLLQYCRRDVEIIEKVMTGWFEFIRRYDLGKYAYTLPGQAFNAYRHRFMPVKIHLHRKDQPETLEKEAYYGGRCECFYIGKVNSDQIYKLDINSMYPSVMIDNDYPIRFMYNKEDPTIRKLKIACQKYCVIAKVEIKTDKPAYPYKMNNKLVFPIGQFTTTLCTPELKYALNHKHIIEVYQIALYNKAQIFNEYVHFFYNLRNKFKTEDNNIYQFIAKKFLNSLYGKFGQKERLSETIDYSDCLQVSSEYFYNVDTNEKGRRIIFGGKQKTITITEHASRNALTAIAAHVTSYARLKLQKVIDMIPENSYFYCDTDSLFINTKALNILKNEINQTELGKWKIEDVTDKLIIRGLKDYTFGSNKKVKGITKDAIKLDKNKYEINTWPGFPLVFTRKLDEPYIVKPVIKTLLQEYTKGIKTVKGKVKPFSLPL